MSHLSETDRFAYVMHLTAMKHVHVKFHFGRKRFEEIL